MNKGCGRKLAQPSWWNFCGETDMGQTAPALCEECGGPYVLMEVVVDPRAEATGKAVAQDLTSKPEATVAAKDPGKGHFYVSIVKSCVRFLGYGMMIGVGGYIAYAGIALIVAEVLGIAEELVD